MSRRSRARRETRARGTKAVGGLALGSPLVVLAQSSGGLANVMGTVQSWLSGQHRRSDKLGLDVDVTDVTGLPSAKTQRLINAWIERHAKA